MNKQILGIGLFIIVCIIAEITLFAWYKLDQENMELKRKLSQFEMYYEKEFNRKFNDSDGINGITGIAHLDKGFFCVYVKDRTYSEVIETCNHEWLHFKFDGKHFNFVNE